MSRWQLLPRQCIPSIRVNAATRGSLNASSRLAAKTVAPPIGCPSPSMTRPLQIVAADGCDVTLSTNGPASTRRSETSAIGLTRPSEAQARKEAALEWTAGPGPGESLVSISNQNRPPSPMYLAKCRWSGPPSTRVCSETSPP